MRIIQCHSAPPVFLPHPSVNFFKCTHLHSPERRPSSSRRRPVVSRRLSRYQRPAVAAICGRKTKQQKLKVKICRDVFCCAKPPGVNNVTSACFSKNHQRNWPDPIGDHFYLSRLSNRFRLIYFNQMFLFGFFLPGPHGATSSPLFTQESALCITETRRVVAATRLVCQPAVCSALSRSAAAAAATLPL